MLRRHAFDAFLVGLSVACIILMFITSTDPLLPVLAGTAIATLLTQFPTGNQIGFDLSVGVLTSVLMYFLIVKLPERAKRAIIRKNLSTTYDSCKQQCIAVYLGCFMNSYPADLPKELSEQKRFREFFKADNGSAQTKWDAVANGLDEQKLKTLIVELEILMAEIHFTLTSIDIQDQRSFEFLKRLSRIIYRSKNWTTEYEDTKSMLGFLWSLHSGWSWVDSYADRDPIEDMISAI